MFRDLVECMALFLDPPGNAREKKKHLDLLRARLVTLKSSLSPSAGAGSSPVVDPGSGLVSADHSGLSLTPHPSSPNPDEQ